jgi:hypothetical protein
MNDQTLETLRGWTVACTEVLSGTRSRPLRARASGIAAWILLREGSGKVEAGWVSLVGVFGQRPREHAVEVREIGSVVRYPRWRRTQVVADDDSAI